MSELREIARKYTREYIRLRKETNQLLREGKIDKQEADHRNGKAKQFLLFAQFQLESARKTSGANITDTRSKQNWRGGAEKDWH
jgi:hypothetical protein